MSSKLLGSQRRITRGPLCSAYVCVGHGATNQLVNTNTLSSPLIMMYRARHSKLTQLYSFTSIYIQPNLFACQCFVRVHYQLHIYWCSVLGFTLFAFMEKILFCKQVVKPLIRGYILRRLTWVFTIDHVR